MKRMIPLVLLVVFTACNNSFIDEKVSVDEVSELVDSATIAAESVPIEDVIPIMATSTKAEYEAIRLVNNPDSTNLVTVKEYSISTPLTKAGDYTIIKVEYNWIEDMTYVTMQGVTNHEIVLNKTAVTISESVANKWGIDPGYYYVYSWKLTLVYNQSRSHEFVIGDYAGVNPSDENSYGYDLVQTGSNQWTVSTIYYRYEKRSIGPNSDSVIGVYCIPVYSLNEPGVDFNTFKWQYTLQGDYSSK